MLAVDRGNYYHESNPYLDQPRKIGYNVTISAPHMVNKLFFMELFFMFSLHNLYQIINNSNFLRIGLFEDIFINIFS